MAQANVLLLLLDFHRDQLLAVFVPWVEIVQLLKTHLAVQLEDPLKPWDEIRGALRVLAGTSSVEAQGEPIVVDVPERRRRSVLQVRAMRFDFEKIASVEEAAEQHLALLKEVGQYIAVSKVTYARFDAISVEPQSLPFHQMVDKFRQKFLKSGSLIDSATDFGLTMDRQDGKAVRHYQLGPMESAQLHPDFLIWKRTDLPERFTFVSIGSGLREDQAYGVDKLEAFVRETARWQKSEIENVTAYLKG